MRLADFELCHFRRAGNYPNLVHLETASASVKYDSKGDQCCNDTAFGSSIVWLKFFALALEINLSPESNGARGLQLPQCTHN